MATPAHEQAARLPRVGMSLASRRVTSHLSPDGHLTVRVEEEAVPAPGPGEVIVRIDGAPINPIDVKTMFCGLAPADLSTGTESGQPCIVGRLPPEKLGSLRSRIGVSVPAGVEGTGIVVSAGSGPEAQATVGRRVAVAQGGMFGDYCRVSVSECLTLPDGASVESAAAASINPMTALAMLETMRGEGHRALCLTAAASNLGQILNRVCLHDGVPLVSIVRSTEQVALLRASGARFVLDSTDPGFDAALEDALAATGATIAFDATGGGSLAGRLLGAMERSLAGGAPLHGRYGTEVHKQLYFFGGLDPDPVTFRRDFGMAWGMGGWLLQRTLAKLAPERVLAMKQRVRDQLDTIFASGFAGRIGLGEMMDEDRFRRYVKPQTGQKLLVVPT